MNKPTYQYTPLANLGSALSILLMCNCLLLVVSIGSDLMEINMLKRIVAGEFVLESEIDANDARVSMLGIFSMVFFLVLAITFLKWIYRASANAHVYSDRDMTYSAGWSVGWFFVPIMNLFRPYQAMKETWKVSAAGPDDDPSVDVSVPSILPWWWGLWIVSGIANRAAFRLTMNAETYEDLLHADNVWIVSHVLALCLSVAAIQMVRGLTRIQSERGEETVGSSTGQVCPECGEPIQTTAIACPMCGASLRTAPAEFESNPFADPNPSGDSNPFAT